MRQTPARPHSIEQASAPVAVQPAAPASHGAARVSGLFISRGGVPKLPVETAIVTTLGLQGDSQRDKKYHGGPERALCLYSSEVIERLRAEGHPITPGASGENVTIRGLDWDTVQPSRRLRLGADVLIEIASHCTPCRTIKACFTDGKFGRILHTRHPGESRLYARVLQTGIVRVGDAVTEIESVGGAEPEAKPESA